MATTRYTITYNVPAHTRLQAILTAGAMLRTGVRVLDVVRCEPAPVLGWWDCVFEVEEDLSDPPMPVFLHEDPDFIDHAPDSTWTKA